MDICLLCLELKHESVEFIKVNSIKLPDNESIEEVIEKHLWPMESISCNSWLCRCCWQILYEFHKFYMRIEEAHEDLANMLDVDIPFEKEAAESNISEQPVQENVLNHFDVLPNHEEILNNRLEEPLSNLHLNEQQLIQGDHDQMEIIQEIVTDLQNNEAVQQVLNLHHNEEQLQEMAQSLLADHIPDDQFDVVVSKVEEQQNTEEISTNLEANQLKIIENTKQKSYDENLAAHINGKKILQKYIKDPRFKSNLSEDVLNKHTMKINHPEERSSNSENFNDTETDSNSSSETSLTLEKVNRKLAIYDSLPNNKRDEDDRVIGQYVKLKCNICEVSLKTFHDLRCHYKSEHNQHGYHKCCEKVFRRRNLLADHIRWHMDPEYFKCSQCGKLMAERRCLELHIINIHQNRGKCFECDICKKAFGDAGTLRNHKLIHLPEEEKKFQCTYCKKNFGSKHLLGNHISSVHLMKYIKVCDICGKKFRVKMKFERHMLEHKGVVKPSVKCDICGFQSVDEACLRRHKYAQHPEGGKTEYQCHLCLKISPSLRAHKVHVQYNHEMASNFKCTICDKAFKRAHCLKEHIATHTRTDLYTCPYCPMKFKSNANLHKHRKNTHPMEWEKDRRKKFSGTLPPTNQKSATY